MAKLRSSHMGPFFLAHWHVMTMQTEDNRCGQQLEGLQKGILNGSKLLINKVTQLFNLNLSMANAKDWIAVHSINLRGQSSSD